MREEIKNRVNVPMIYDIVDSISIFKNQAKKRYKDYVSKDYNLNWHYVIDDRITDSEDLFHNANHIDPANTDQFID